MKFAFSWTDEHHDADNAVTEHHDRPHIKTQEQAEKQAREWIDYYNDTLRPGESPRTFLKAWMEGDSEVHDWFKTTASTVIDQHGAYDRMQCRNCGITGKRFGLGQAGVVIDSKFRSLKFKPCNAETKAKVAAIKNKPRKAE